MFQLSDLFIGDYPVIEHFGANPDVYSVRYKIQGYPGLRFKMPSLTPLLACADGYVLETGFEPAGKGKYLTLVHDGFLSTYGHMNDFNVQKDDKVIAGQLIGHSNQSGFTDVPCLYFGIAPCDAAGNKTEQNGYDGYIDPMSEQIDWKIQNLQEPVTEKSLISEMTMTNKEYTALNSQAGHYRVILNFLKQSGFDEWLHDQGRAPINLTATPDDPSGAESIMLFMKAIADESKTMEENMQKLLKDNTEKEALLAKKKVTLPSILPKSFLLRWINGIGRFIFIRWADL